jgi:predicted RNA-binding Zn-ribbon protein involved in translation (DUF1610 family)
VNESNGSTQAPDCPSDGFRMTATIVGWRCPICGIASLPIRRDLMSRAKAAHPAFR